MNKIYDERGKGFEKKFQMDEELQFKIAARSNKYLGEWASSMLGKNEEEIKKYHLKWDDIFEFFPDNIIRDLMNSVELDLIAMSMKGMDEEVVTRVKNNLPQKKQAMYEPVEGAVSKREVDNARKGIVQAAKQMEKDGAFKLEDFIGGGEMVE